MENFQEKFKLDRLNSKVNTFSLSKLKYHEHIQKVKQLKIMDQKESNDLRFLKRYDVIEVNSISKLIHLVTEQENLKYYVFDEELYEVLFEAHTLTGHGGRDRMIKQ
ncbi:hypothetical protein HHI36_013991 [Cryptolaemus montrouzieri]|uniref:Integrase zinc-binding domain-containing protein n=1 Tax=Cryptolaemus montrouzieri TaxID=559131 RepID=A0ABD2N1J3_9CUCU